MPVKAEFQADFRSFNEGVDAADRKLAQFGRTAEKTAGSSNQFSKAIGQADSVLSQAGINVGGTAKALDEIAGASGKTVASLGALGAAGLVVGTAMAAWNFGRQIAGWLGTDEAIGKATASLLGWGDVAAEVTGAQQDVVNAAIRNGAAATISYTEALKFNTDFHKKRLETVKEAAKADEKTAEAMKELNSVGGTLNATLATMSGTVVEAVKYYLAAGVSQGALATAYGLTAAQVKAVADSVTDLAAKDKAWLEQMKADSAEAELYASILQGAVKKAYEDTAAANAKATIALTAKTDTITASILAESAARESLTQTVTSTDALTAAWVTMNTKLAELQKSKVGDIDTTARQQVIYKEYTDTLLAEAQAVDDATQAFWRARDAVNAKSDAVTNATKQTGVYMNQLKMLVTDPNLASFFGGNAAANTLYSGGKGGFTPEEAAAMGAGQMINFAGNSFATGRIPGVNININSPLGTPDQIAKAVSGALTPRVMQGAKLSGS